MARGDKAVYNQQEQQSYGQDQGVAQQDANNQQGLYGTLLPDYQNEFQNAGYTPAEQQAMTQATTGSLAGAFGAARDRIMDRAARTGNSAGANVADEDLGLQQGQQNAQALGALQGQFANARQRDQQNALSGMESLYGSTTQGLDSALNTGANLVGTQGRVAVTPGFWSQFVQRGIGGLGRGFGGGGGI